MPAVRRRRQHACARLQPRWAIPLFTAGIVAISALHELIARDGTLADTIIADTSAIVFFFMGYLMRQFRIGQARAEQLVEELEETRDAQAQAVTLRDRQHLAREMHDVLAHSLSALAVQLEGARLLARSAGADRSVVDAVERSDHLAKGGLEEARRAIEAHTNVRRHPDAEHVDLRLRYADDGTWLTVEDRGRRANGAHEPGLGYGLTGMRERAELLGGRLAAAPTSEGLRVELYIPA